MACQYNMNEIRVENLPTYVDNNGLGYIFSVFGEILDLEVLYHNGHHLGIGFIKFANQQQAAKAIRAMFGQFIGVFPLVMSYSHSSVCMIQTLYGFRRQVVCCLGTLRELQRCETPGYTYQILYDYFYVKALMQTPGYAFDIARKFIQFDDDVIINLLRNPPILHQAIFEHREFVYPEYHNRPRQ